MISYIRRPAIGVLLALSAYGATPVVAGEAEELLRSMQSAVHSLSYSGKLVFSRGSELSEYKIEHQPGQGANTETVIKLGKGDASANQQQFSLVNSSSLRLPDQKAYSIDIGGNTQIAGLPCKVVVVRPKDKMRYLHRYCISPQTGMLLRYSVMNREQQLLEQFMFTQLNVAVPQQQAQTIQQQPSVANNLSNGAMPGTWDFSDLPRGFSVNQVKAVPGKPEAHQIILFDGLTFVSVFIEPGDVTAYMKKHVPASGATNILTKKMAQHTVTLVGEVPKKTLQAIQNGLRHVSP